MKVLQVVKTSKGANWAFEQAKCINANGIEIVTILPDNNGDIVKKYIENNMKIYIVDVSLPIRKMWSYFKNKKKIQEIVNKEKPDIIHIHFVTNIIMFRLALKKSKIPRLFQVPGPLHLESTFFRKLDTYTANEYDYWAPSCKRSEQLYELEKIPKSRLFLAYYGGAGGKNIDNFSSNNNILHKEYNIPKDKILIGMVSYFYKPKYYLGQKRGIKGHEDFIDAINILNKANDNITAIIIGGPWGNSQKYQDKVKKYAQSKNLKNVIFTGFRNDIKKIYKELDIVVHPSHSENLGGAAESLAAAVPTITTDVGGFPDIVIDNETGYLCKPKNPKMLAEKIQLMIDDMQKAKKMAISGQEKVRDMLDINNTSREIINIYNKMIGDNN